jgi:sulfite reductase alpha subunit-like flavoprotein
MSRKMLVMYGSQTGNAQSIAEVWIHSIYGIYVSSHFSCLSSKQIHEDALTKNFESDEALPLNNWKKLDQPFDQQQLVIIVCSTSGNGEAPDNCGRFFRFVKKVKNAKDMLAGVNYAVMALGGMKFLVICIFRH